MNVLVTALKSLMLGISLSETHLQLFGINNATCPWTNRRCDTNLTPETEFDLHEQKSRMS